MNEDTHRNWFTSLKNKLETAYILHDEPWKQSGFSGPEERWVACRKPIADCVDKSGTFLDIGCANGYLLECVLKWTNERGLTIIPYGLDLSEKLVKLAKQRLPEYKENLFVGNGWDWESPIQYDYVRTELVYVPEHLRKQYLQRIIDSYLTDNGKLLVADYRLSKEPVPRPFADEILTDWGFIISNSLSGYYNNIEMIRVLVVEKQEEQ